MKMKIETPWIGLPVDFSPINLEGFVYLIEQISTGKKYIGKKSFWSRRKPPKTKKRRRRVRRTVESDWKFYRSSSKDLKQEISRKGIDDFIFTVLSLHQTKGQLNYHEVKQQFIREVLEDKDYFNDCILGRYFKIK